MLNSPNIKSLFSDFRRNVQAFGTPWWISDLLNVADEVRDRTIFVKIKSQLHSWTDLEIKYLFSEFGMVEEVTYLPEVSGFHSRVRFQTIYDSEWAYYYYQDGWFVHQNCCEIQIHRADDVISWNTQRIDKIKAAYVVSDTPKVTSVDSMLKERVKQDKLITQGEELSQFALKDESISAKEPSDGIAHQVLDKMPRSFVSGELVFLDEIEKINEELVDGFKWEAPPMRSVERLDDAGEEKELIQVEGSEPVAVKEISDFTAHQVLEEMSQSTETIEVNLTGVLTKDDEDDDDLLEMASWVEEDFEPPTYTKGYMKLMCFDPGGNSAGVLLERHIVDYDLSCNCCLYSIEWVNWVAYMLRAQTTDGVVKSELLKCFDMKGCLISIFLDYKIFSDKHSSHYVTTFLSSKWVGNSVTRKEVWKSLAKRYLMIVNNKEFASDKYWKCDLGTTLWCWETHDYLFHFAKSLVNLEPSSSKEKNGDAAQGLEGSGVESVSNTNDMENSYADVGSLFGIAPKTCFSNLHLKGEGHYSVALYCRRNHQMPENTSYLEVAPALAASCAAMLKPSKLASLTCLELGQVCKDVGLPAGVLNILTGLGLEAGAPLASHPDVDKIAFTGSNATGSKIMSSASQVVKSVTMELGGKSPIIAFEDVDLDKAAEWTAFGCFWTNGRICSAKSRLIVHENIATAVVHGHQEGRILIFIFDPGGTVKLNTKSLETKSYGVLMAPLLHSFYAYTVQFMILGDKDHLKEGVLLQDFGVEPGLSRFRLLYVLNPLLISLYVLRSGL